jgi:VanZ like protein
VFSVQHHPAGSAEPIRPANEGRGSSQGRNVVRPRVRMAALAMLAAYLLLIGWLSLRPLELLWVSPANLRPFDTIRADIDQGPQAAFRAIGVGMLRLAPLGVLLPLLGRHLGGARFASLFRTVCAGAAISLLIEWLQSLKPSRVSDVDAIILNTMGIALVHLVCYGWLRAIALRVPQRGKRRTKLSQGAAPAATDRPSGHHPPAGHGEATRDRAAPPGVRGAALSR